MGAGDGKGRRSPFPFPFAVPCWSWRLACAPAPPDRRAGPGHDPPRRLLPRRDRLPGGARPHRLPALVPALARLRGVDRRGPGRDLRPPGRGRQLADPAPCSEAGRVATGPLHRARGPHPARAGASSPRQRLGIPADSVFAAATSDPRGCRRARHRRAQSSKATCCRRPTACRCRSPPPALVRRDGRRVPAPLEAGVGRAARLAGHDPRRSC